MQDLGSLVDIALSLELHECPIMGVGMPEVKYQTGQKPYLGTLFFEKDSRSEKLLLLTDQQNNVFKMSKSFKCHIKISLD